MFNNISFKAHLEKTVIFPERKFKGKFETMKQQFEQRTKDLPEYTMVFSDFDYEDDEDIIDLYKKDKKVCRFKVDFTDWNSKKMSASRLIGFLHQCILDTVYVPIFENLEKERDAAFKKLNEKYDKKEQKLNEKKTKELYRIFSKYNTIGIRECRDREQYTCFDIEEYWRNCESFIPDIDEIVSKISKSNMSKESIKNSLNEKERAFLEEFTGIDKEKLFHMDKKTYRENSIKYHPDKNNTKEAELKFQILNILYSAK